MWIEIDDVVRNLRNRRTVVPTLVEMTFKPATLYEKEHPVLGVEVVLGYQAMRLAATIGVAALAYLAKDFPAFQSELGRFILIEPGIGAILGLGDMCLLVNKLLNENTRPKS